MPRRKICKVDSSSLHIHQAYLYNLRNAFKKVSEFSKPIISHTTLMPKVVMIRWNKFVECHTTLRVMLQQIDNLQRKLFGPLHLFLCLVCKRVKIRVNRFKKVRMWRFFLTVKFLWINAAWIINSQSFKSCDSYWLFWLDISTAICKCTLLKSAILLCTVL